MSAPLSQLIRLTQIFDFNTKKDGGINNKLPQGGALSDDARLTSDVCLSVCRVLN